MPNLECPRCGVEVSANDIHCLKCGFNLTKPAGFENDPFENDPQFQLFSDILSFPFIPIKSSWQYDDFYREIAARGSLQKLILLPIFNNFVAIMGVYLLVGNNPYIDIGIDPLTFTVLGTCSFLILTFVRFIAFRLVSGKGNLVAQGYLDAIVTTDYLLLYCLSLIPLFIFRSEGLSNFIVIAGGIYLLIPSLVSLAAVHHLSGMRTIAGFILSILFSTPFFFLFFFLLNLFRKAWPFEIYDWRLLTVFCMILLLFLFVVFYAHQEGKFSGRSDEKVAINRTIRAIMGQKKVKYTFLVLVVLIVCFVFLDSRNASIKTQRSPFLLSFAPNHDPDLLYIGTKYDEYGDQTYINVLHLTTGEIKEDIEIPMWVARMRPGESGDSLILLDRGSSRGDAEILNLDTLQPTYGHPMLTRFEYLEDWGIKNFSRNEMYYVGGRNGVNVPGIKIEPDIRFYSVAIHPNGKIIYLVADNQIKVVDAESKETLDTIRLGGKLRDAAVSPDGEQLYVADALWNRIRVIPIDAQE